MPETLVDSPLTLLPFGAQLASTEESIDGQFTGNLGEVLIRCEPNAMLSRRTTHSTVASRCNNVLYLRAAPQEEDDDAGMPERCGDG